MYGIRVSDEFYWTQADLAEASGVSISTISDIECHRGPHTRPRQGRRRKTATRLKTAIKLAVALEKLPPGEYVLNLSLNDFVAGQDLFSDGEMFRPKRRPKRRLRAVA